MISLACTHCKTLLTMDDAFAGGVCRCQYCGTIQTVPSHLAGSGDAQADAAQTQQAGSKTLYRNRAADGAGTGAASNGGGTAVSGASGSGLDEIATIVASSGLASQRLRRGSQKSPRAAPRTATASSRNLTWLLIPAGAVIVILLALVIWFAMRLTGSPTAPTAANSAVRPSQSHLSVQATNHDGSTAAPTVAPDNSVASPAPVNNPSPKTASPGKPSFLGTDLSGAASVVYVLDRGNATQAEFDAMKLAVINSIGSLGSTKKFALIFWNNDDNKNPDVMFPPSGLSSAGAAAVADCRKVCDSVYAFGQSNVKSALQKAVALHPSVIVLATGKSVDDDFSREVLDIAKGHARIDTFSLNFGAVSTPLNDIASQTGGVYRDVPDDALQNASD